MRYLDVYYNYLKLIDKKRNELGTYLAAKEETNLRDKPTTESDIIHTLVNGEYVTLVAESDSGWAKLMYNGRAVYAIKSFLQ